MRAAKAAMLRYAAGETDQACKKPLKSIAESLGLYCRRPSRMPKPMELPDAVPAESPERGDWLAHKLWDQFFADPLPFLLHQYDRCSMASGVECRMPFLDYRLVEFIFSLPLSSRVGGRVTKRILRKAMEGLVPEEVLKNRRKIGFNAPLRHWLSGPLRGWIMDIAASKVFLENPYFKGKEMYCAIEKELRTANPQLCLGNMWPCVHLSWWQMQNKKMRLRYGEIL